MIAHASRWKGTPLLMATWMLWLIAGSHLSAQGNERFTLSKNGWTLALSANGSVESLKNSAGQELASRLCGDGRVSLASAPEGQVPKDWLTASLHSTTCEKPTKVNQTADSVTFEYDLSETIGLRLRDEIRLRAADSRLIIERAVTLISTKAPFDDDILLQVNCNIAPKGGPATIFVPRRDGVGQEVTATGSEIWSWPLHCPARLLTLAEHLAIPMISQTSGEPALRVTQTADPFWDVSLRAALPTSKTPGMFACLVRGSQVPWSEPLVRRFWIVVHEGDAEEALAAWYATALADVPAGPDWLHTVAWQHYDYLSHGGKGWFEDIDAFTQLVAPPDRGKVLLALHGWYGLLGQYAFDEKAGKLLDAWTAMPNAAAMKDKGFPTSESLNLTRSEMHRRIHYAKERGFRVALYYADGLMACEGAGLYSEDQLLNWGGWRGPDTIGKSYMQNPAHPRVYHRYIAYLKALLAEYGNEIDALIWDETFMVRWGMAAPPQSPVRTYLPGVYMRLMHDLTITTVTHRKELAFLSSDCIGFGVKGKIQWPDIPPYAIMSHGCYQDSHCEPVTWPYAIFPNYRNVFWSCNWQAVGHFDYTEFGVRHYDTPVATSNGYLDDKGLARLSDEQRGHLLKLFAYRKDRPQHPHYLTGPAPQFRP